MRNFRAIGERVTRTAPEGGVISGVPVVIGSEFLVPEKSASEGEPFVGIRTGVVSLPAATGHWFSEGAKVYWNPKSGKCEASDTADNFLIGTAGGPASGGKVDVVLKGTIMTDGNLDSKADKVVGAVAGNLAVLTSGGNLADSGVAVEDVVLRDGSVPLASYLKHSTEVVAAGEEEDSVKLQDTTQAALITTRDLTGVLGAAGSEGSTYILTVNSSKITPETPCYAVVAGGSFTTGLPLVLRTEPGDGMATVRIENADSEDGVNGTVVVAFFIG